jgi:thiol-disulfide isomerase/thioredoxin
MSYKATFLLVFVLSVLAAQLPARAARADNGLSIEQELLRPGVRVLAVEFYATWCKPCMEAVPRWKALHDRYRDKGLRLVVVAVQDDGRCVNPGWTPDAMVCDEDGRFSQAFKVGDKLPAAFLWSWTGKLLVQRGHVDEVARAVEQELAQVPRVTLTVRQDGPDVKVLAEVATLLRSELRKGKKLDVVATKDEKAALDQIRRESQKSGYAELSQCKMGEEMAANSMLKAEISRTGREPKLLLQLFSAEQGCLTQSGQGRWRPDEPDASVAEAVADLLGRLRVELQMPGAGAVRPAIRERIQGPKDATWAAPGDDTVLVAFTSTPAGARVDVDGSPLCNATPCKRPLSHGDHRVRMTAETRLPREDTVRVGEGTGVSWTLEANTASVRVDTGIANIPLRIDGETAGNSPLTVDLAAGPHRIEIASQCYEAAQADVVLQRGTPRTVTLPAQVKTGGLRVELSDGNGEPLEGTVLLDGKDVGAAWKTLTVSACGKALTVSTRLGVWTQGVVLKAREVTKVTATQAGGARPRADVPAGRPAAERSVVVKAGETAAVDVALVRPDQAQAAVSPRGSDAVPAADTAGDYSARSWEDVAAMPYFDGDAARFAGSRNGTVVDKKLHLVWQQADSGKDMDWAEAKAYCAGLVLAGQRGWRLPTIAELGSLNAERREDRKKIAAVAEVFSFVHPRHQLWSGTPRLRQGGSDSIWIASFQYNGGNIRFDGAVNFRMADGNLLNAHAPVRCIR